MKKVFCLLFFLSACMVSPQKSFQLDSDSEIYMLEVDKIETISMAEHFDTLPHVEKQMQISPEEAIIEWVEMHFKASETTQKKMGIVIYRAEMLQTNLPNDGMFKLDEVQYTLNYELEIQIRDNNQVIKKFPVKGKGFVVIAKRASLSKKEKSWALLIQKMLTHLKTKIKENVLDS